MPAKIIQVSDDAGSNYYVLPGNTGEFNDESNELDDTIFGQNYKSAEVGLQSWNVTSNALYKGFAGYLVDIKEVGSASTFTGEACSLVSGKTFEIDDITKNIFDRSATFVVYDNAVDQTSEVESINYLTGEVTFVSTYSVTTPVTMDGSSFAVASLAKYRSFSMTQSAEAVDTTDIPAAQAASGIMTFQSGLKTVSIDVSGVYAAANGYRADLIARNEVILEINPDGNGFANGSLARGFFKVINRGQSGNVGDLEEETVTFSLQVPQDVEIDVTTPFTWNHAAASTLSTAVQKVLTAFLNESTLKVQYLPDGSTGLEGDVVVTDVSLSGGQEAMSEFSVGFQGTGAVSTV